MPKLVVHSGKPQTHDFELKAGTNTLGRDVANDFTIDDPSVSSFHAKIIVDGSSVSIKDLGSTNGTFILHSQVNEGVIQPGQFIRLGNVYLVFEADSPASMVVPGGAPAVIPTVAVPNAWQQARTAGSTSVPSGDWLTTRAWLSPFPIASERNESNSGIMGAGPAAALFGERGLELGDGIRHRAPLRDVAIWTTP